MIQLCRDPLSPTYLGTGAHRLAISDLFEYYILNTQPWPWACVLAVSCAFVSARKHNIELRKDIDITSLLELAAEIVVEFGGSSIQRILPRRIRMRRLTRQMTLDLHFFFHNLAAPCRKVSEPMGWSVTALSS